ncbi:MAG: gliding motility protein GldN [Muribaculaceae bacterium]|nr:gliding motility protein GldN [Muribaculaceae bacterium]MCI6494201.1 gliding motility protein GldN [Bacteroidales bacterium]MDD6701985.1 gliding motility protein GldN [Bacteroidales bacterium]
MKLFRKVFLLATVAACAVAGVAQVENAGGVRKRSERDKKSTPREGEVSQRMQDFYTAKEPHDADISYMREIYRQLDLNVPENTPLYYPEDVVDGQKNLFRLILGLVVDGKIPAYEYLDGREAFTDQYKVKVAEMLDRFGIYYTHGKGGTERNPKFVIEEADVPTGQVLTYYIIEKWEFDRRSNRMKTRVEAICPVLNRMGDFGGEAKYPMFWVKYDQLRPYLAQQYVFLTDDNNLPQYSLDDYFNLGMYKGDIYKTRNLRNLSMVQMYPDPDDLARAQDSIDRRLREYGKDLWVPTREEYLAQKEKEEAIAKAIADGDSIPGRTVVEDKSVTETKKARKTTRKRSSKKAKVSSSAPKSSAPNSNATKSVRRRKK